MNKFFNILFSLYTLLPLLSIAEISILHWSQHYYFAPLFILFCRQTIQPWQPFTLLSIIFFISLTDFVIGMPFGLPILYLIPLIFLALFLQKTLYSPRLTAPILLILGLIAHHILLAMTTGNALAFKYMIDSIFINLLILCIVIFLPIAPSE